MHLWGDGGQRKLLLFGVVLLCTLAHPEAREFPTAKNSNVENRERPKSPAGDMIRIDFERTGGFAGMRVATTISSGSLSPEEARQLRELVDASGFFGLPAEIPGPTEGADRFLYRLTVEFERGRHTVLASEAAIPASLRPLIDWLTKAARKSRQRGSTP